MQQSAHGYLGWRVGGTEVSYWFSLENNVEFSYLCALFHVSQLTLSLVFEVDVVCLVSDLEQHFGIAILAVVIQFFTVFS